MASQQRIPAFYRVVFIWIDGLFSLVTAYIHLIDYAPAIQEHFPDLPGLAAEPFIAPFIYPIGGSMLFVATIQLFLLPHTTNDIRTWKVVQAGLVFQDLSMVAGCYKILEAQGRGARLADAFGSGAFTGLVMTGVRTVVRVLFLSGVGERVAVESNKVGMD